MIATLDNSNGDLWVKDQVNPPPECSIMFLSMEWHSSMVFAMAKKAPSSTKPETCSSFPCAISMRSAL